MILSESELSQRAAQETLPLRDAFAVLFFVSVGMLVDPDDRACASRCRCWRRVLIIVVGKSAGRVPDRAPVRLSDLACADDLGEPRPDRRVLLHPGRPRRRASPCCPSAAATWSWPAPSSRSCSIPCCSPASTGILRAARAEPRRQPSAGTPEAAEPASREPIRATTLTDHVVLVGYGRVGRIVAGGLTEQRVPLLLIEEIRPLRRRRGRPASRSIHGNAADRGGARGRQPAAARCLLVAIPDAFEGGQVVAQARRINPDAADHRPLAFRGGDRAPEEARRQQGDHGRARDRHRHAGRCPGSPATLGAGSHRCARAALSCAPSSALMRARDPRPEGRMAATSINLTPTAMRWSCSARPASSCRWCAASG